MRLPEKPLFNAESTVNGRTLRVRDELKLCADIG